VLKATAHRSDRERYTHSVQMRQHQIVLDEPVDKGGDDLGPSPQELLAASLATCTAITIEMYAKRKGWDIGEVEVQVDYTPAEQGAPTRFKVEMRLPAGCTSEQLERLQVIAAKCPVHRILEGDTIFTDRVKLVSHAAS
jgi:putative redox protein